MPLRDSLSNTWAHIQANLFPWLAEELGPLTEKHKQLITVLEVARIEAFVSTWSGLPGRPPHDRAALARAFVAKTVIGLPTTSMLIDRLAVDKRLRRLCGWERPGQVPSESTFSRAFAEFAESELPSRVHEALIKTTHAERLVGHISRDATAIEAREKPVKIEPPETPQRTAPRRARWSRRSRGGSNAKPV
jgi:transposase